MKIILYSILISSFVTIGLYQALIGKMKDEVGEEFTSYFLSKLKILKVIYYISFILPLIVLLFNEKWYWAITKYIILYFLIVFLTVLNSIKLHHNTKMYLIIVMGLINVFLAIIYFSINHNVPKNSFSDKKNNDEIILVPALDGIEDLEKLKFNTDEGGNKIISQGDLDDSISLSKDSERYKKFKKYLEEDYDFKPLQ